MLMKKIVMVASLCTLLIAGVHAAGHGCDKHNKMAKALNLSEAQIELMDALHEDKKAHRKQRHEEKSAMHEGFNKLLDNYSEQGANTLADNAANVARTMTLARINHMQKMYEILDDEQKEKFKELMAKRAEHGHGWGRHHKGKGFAE